MRGSKTSYKQNKYFENYKQIYLSSLTGKNKIKQNKFAICTMIQNTPCFRQKILHTLLFVFFFSFILGADVPREIGRQWFCKILGKCIVGDEQMANFY